eukprot:CAMPEP_0184655930 /NCGR_PEP_ID=MMETSP0308-20130426/14969_1 /TAXON_ID=38269 /ORGANISM="Gloeochaete witrockiana, Strain SAG 46.84" /LENGTH=135 /DNA_ID=CAMNT_0027092759 /DNA_START=51 /DNA_END=459 /DNA_ORIENTATION=-
MFSVKFLELAASVGLTQSPEDERRRPTSPKGDSTLETLGTVIKEVAESLVLDDDEDEEEEENQRPARLAPIQKPAERDQETTSVLVCSVVDPEIRPHYEDAGGMTALDLMTARQYIQGFRILAIWWRTAMQSRQG